MSNDGRQPRFRQWRARVRYRAGLGHPPPLDDPTDPKRIVRYPQPEPRLGDESADTHESWDLTPVAHEPRVGVACSGGGIRSASFTLGALQAIDASPDDRRGLERVRYVAAVSGGGYTAGGWAVSTTAAEDREPNKPAGADTEGTDDRGVDDDEPEEPAGAGDPESAGDEDGRGATRRPFAQGSPEEERLRRNSSLIPNAGHALAGLGRLTMGLAINLLLLWAIMIVVAAPVGWVVSSTALHPELRAESPLIEIEDQAQIVRDQSFPAERDVPKIGSFLKRAESCDTCATGDDEDDTQYSCPSTTCRVWEVEGLDYEALGVEVTSIHGTTLTDSPYAGAEVVPDKPAIVAVEDGKLQVLQQPTVSIKVEPPPPDDEQFIFVEQQPRLAVTNDDVVEPSADDLRVERDPVVAQRTGTHIEKDLESDSWHHRLALIAVIVAILLGVVRIVVRPVGRTNTKVLRLLAFGSSAIAAVSALLVYLIPWIIVTVPSFVADLPSWLPFLGDERLTDSSLINTTAFAFFLTLLQTGVRLLKGPATKAARRRPLQFAQAAVVLFLFATILAVLADILEVAAANGPGGHISDFVLHPTFRIENAGFIEQLSLADGWRWLIVVALLTLWAYVADAHSWSLFPFYKRWIGRAFVSAHGDESDGGPGFPPAPAPSPQRPFPDPTTWMANGRLGDSGPQLISCCAVNLSELNAAASSRKAGSFTFSSDWVGGPDVGWVPTDIYWKRLGDDDGRWRPKGRRKDTTVVATMAISGAAFSPGMGKKSMGAIGGLMALGNARLGVWLPHPRAVVELDEQGKRWVGRPGWPWWFREVIQRFKREAPYLYVSDGGHWENLGVVELLRRGCNQVYVVSAAGDGVDSFTTIGEAIALAREELGIEIEGIDLDRMRPPRGDAPKGEEVLVRSDGSTTRFAPSAFAVGTLRQVGQSEPYGRIIFIEVNLTGDLPWDVQSHAEKNSQFPNDSTLNQMFTDRQFESYRRLGYHQMEKALEDVPLP